jgi:ubiquinone/menaquinone biosynthesis C-methylase UbiE
MNLKSPEYAGEAYERYRAKYPAQLAEALFLLTNYRAPETILEIGSGTGKGTEILIERGARVHGIEPNASMGAIAERKFPAGNFSWSNATFENFDSEGKKFPLITSAHAFHWVDQNSVFQKCYDLLESGGALAVYRNNRKYDDEFSRREHQIQVKLNGCDPHGLWNENYYQALAECVTDFIKRSEGRFHRPQVYEFDHTVTYTTESYLGLLGTFWSDSYDNLKWPMILDATAKLIDEMGGTIEYPYTSVLYVLERR